VKDSELHRIVAEWYSEVNEWRLPSEFEPIRKPLETLSGPDEKDHLRILFHVFGHLVPAIKKAKKKSIPVQGKGE